MPTARLSSPVTYAHFAPYLRSNYPALLPPSATEDWPAFELWFNHDCSINYDYLRAQYGQLKVQAVDCGNWEAEQRGFGEVLDGWERGAGARVYVKDWHLPLIIRDAGRKVEDELYQVSDLVVDDWMNAYYSACTKDDFRFVYLGGPSTFTPLHRDVYSSYSISTNLHGNKTWHLFPPSCTSKLQLLLKAAEREDKVVDVRLWKEELRREFEEMGMEVVEQGASETIFIPSGWYHQVTNHGLTFSLNHNWANSHNLPTLYSSMCLENLAVRESISDVKELLMKRHPDNWEKEWEECVGDLLERSAGWNWTTFWSMIRLALQSLDPQPSPAVTSGWPTTPPHAGPSIAFVVSQVSPLLDTFLMRVENERKWTTGLEDISSEVKGELKKLKGLDS
ncbi:hypothetical protein P7C70_g5704, partial [Phenoliferia sp. Uapishka_3]